MKYGLQVNSVGIASTSDVMYVPRKHFPIKYVTALITAESASFAGFLANTLRVPGVLCYHLRKSETRMTASVLEQDANTRKVQY